MSLQKIAFLGLGLLFLGGAWRAFGWMGLAFASGAILMFVLLNFNRTVQVLRRAADRPMGYVGSAVMLNAKLKPRMTLLHVTAMTHALGALRSPEGEQPECYRWTDPGESYVEATFDKGQLTQWQLIRPSTETSAPE